MRDSYERIMQFNQSRDALILPIKYKLMASSAFRFFRGSCHLFYEDLSQQQTWKDETKTWICGDLHVENFGSYRSRHQVVYFDLNDFDEGVLAYPTWELARFICSIFLAGKELNFKYDELKKITKEILEEYLNALKAGKAYAVEKETVDGMLKKYIKSVSERDPLAFLNAHSTLDKSTSQRRLIIDQKKYFEVKSASLKKSLIEAFTAYLKNINSETPSTLKVADVAIRVAGTGSVGLSRYVFLVYDQDKNYTLFDMKLAQASSLAPYLKAQPNVWNNEAQRVQFIQTLMEYEVPAWLSTIEFEGASYIVKALQSEQDKIDFKLCEDKPKKFTDACYNMARLIAYAQLRSSGRENSSIADQLINFAKQADLWKTQLLEYTYNYVHQVEQDYQNFCQRYSESLSGKKDKVGKTSK